VYKGLVASGYGTRSDACCDAHQQYEGDALMTASTVYA